MKTEVDLQRDILDELDWEPSIDAAHVGVTVHEGVVTLTGHVSHYAEKHAAEEMAKHVHGVKAIANEIEVRPGDSHLRDDEDLAAAAVHALTWDAKVPEESVTITVSDGWLKLEGIVDEQYRKAAADRAVRHLIGARGVINDIRVEPGASVREHFRTSKDEVRGRIESALRRSAKLHERCVAVEIDEHTVVLTGDVRSHAELDEAERIAWSARGVTCVENCITVTPFGCGPAEEWGY